MEDLGDHRCESSLVLTIQLLGYLILTHTHLSVSSGENQFSNWLGDTAWVNATDHADPFHVWSKS